MDWSVALPILFGAGISLVSSITMFALGNFYAGKKKADDQLNDQALSAISGYAKLLSYTNLLMQLDGLIDKGFKATHEAGLDSTEAWASAPSSIGEFSFPEKIAITEYRFLLTNTHSDFVNQVQTAEAKVRNNFVLWGEFCRLRNDFQEWLQDHPEIEMTFDGVLSSHKIPKSLEAIHDLKAGQLNSILANIATNLEDDLPFVETVLKKYVLAAHEICGEKFPKLEIVPA